MFSLANRECCISISRNDLFYLAGSEYRGFVVGPVTWPPVVTWRLGEKLAEPGKLGPSPKLFKPEIYAPTMCLKFRLLHLHKWEDSGETICECGWGGFCEDSGGHWLGRDRRLTRVTRQFPSQPSLKYIFFRERPETTGYGLDRGRRPCWRNNILLNSSWLEKTLLHCINHDSVARKCHLQTLPSLKYIFLR